MKSLFAVFLAVVLSGSSSSAFENQPFHVSRFADDTTISLVIRMVRPSIDERYDYDVDIGITALSQEGQKVFADTNYHIVRLRCVPRAMLIGSFIYSLSQTIDKNDWKSDLWKVLCRNLAS